MKSITTLIATFVCMILQGQPVTVVSGKVTESATGSPVPFANVIFVGTQDGAITDFDGNFVAQTTSPVDSIEVRYIGFQRRAKPLQRSISQIIPFQLDEDVQTLGEVVVFSGENPAFPILRNVVKSKPANDKRSLSAYEYESYTKVEFDVDNISERFRQRKMVRKITNVLDSIQQLAGEDGKPILPVFISEAISQFYYKKDPKFRHENILKTKVSGVGITDGTLSSQVIGSTFQEYNFYQNWLNIVTKEFVSPIADGWRIYYDVYLEDSTFIGEDFCYRIDFYPKRAQDLAFTGTMWITKSDYALKRIDAQVTKEANLNYIEKIKIQQDLIRTSAGAWLPEKTRVVVDVAEVTKKTAGMLAKFYVSTKDHVVNQPRPDDFYLNPVVLEITAREYDENFWEENRHDSLSQAEINVFQMIDTLKKIPVVKNYMDAGKFLVNGYYKVGKYDLGPYTTFFGNNTTEGVRIGLAGRTNIDWSNKWTLGGYAGYGFGDDRWKYRVYVDRILDRRLWTNIRVEHQREVEQVWLLNEQIEPNSLFYSLSRFGTLNQPFTINKYRLSFFRQITTGFSVHTSLKHQRFQPLFDFGYFPQTGDRQTQADYEVSEMGVALRYSRDELFLVNDNERLSLGALRWPIFNLNYTLGMRDVLGSDFSYHRLKVSVTKRQKMGLIGVATIQVGGGYTFGDLPYTALFNTIGNETPVYVGFAYNLMNYFEFSNDRYVEMRYRHTFEGFLLSSIPLIQKLKWRMVGSANMLAGSISDRNLAMTVNKTDPNGNEVLPFYRMDHRPYVEVGYGIENIFKIFAVEAFHRVTYLNHPDVSKFALKFSAKFIL